MLDRLAPALLLAAAMASGSALAQAFVVDTRAPAYPPSPAGENGPQQADANDVLMPWAHGGLPGVARRINDALFLLVLDTIAPRMPGDTFAPPPHDGLQNFCSINFSVGRNDSRVLSITMGLDYRGSAHCTSESRAFHFEATTGRLIDVEELLTAEGRIALKTRLRNEAAKTYEAELAILPPDPNAENPDADPDAPPPPQARHLQAGEPDDEEQRQFLTNCLEGWQSSDLSSSLDVELPAEGGMRLPSRSCAGNRREMLMDVAPPPLRVTDSELEPLLTPYGRRLLLGQGTAPGPSDLFGQTLHGHVGSAAVTLQLGRPAGAKREIEAHYAYDRNAEAITLYGHPLDGGIELDESQDKRFTLHQVGQALVGTWRGKGKTLPVRLE